MARMKFKVTEINRSIGAKYVETENGRNLVCCEVRTIRLQPLAGNDSESGKFWVGPPRGQVEFICVSAEAAEEFDLEKEFFVDFTPAR